MVEELDARPKLRYVAPTLRAFYHAVAGEKDEAIRAIERGVADRDAFIINIKTDPVFDSLRAEPGFQEQLKKLGFPP